MKTLLFIVLLIPSCAYSRKPISEKQQILNVLYLLGASREQLIEEAKYQK
jgi:hypothetical protein